MITLSWMLLTVLTSLFKSKCQLEAESVAFRHEVVVVRRQMRGRVRLANLNRLVIAIVQPETVIRWHCAGCWLKVIFSHRLDFYSAAYSSAVIGYFGFRGEFQEMSGLVSKKDWTNGPGLPCPSQ
jgi:hypothetical protein